MYFVCFILYRECSASERRTCADVHVDPCGLLVLLKAEHLINPFEDINLVRCSTFDSRTHVWCGTALLKVSIHR